MVSSILNIVEGRHVKESHNTNKKEKKVFIESVENNAEILVTFLDENRQVFSDVITTRLQARIWGEIYSLF